MRFPLAALLLVLACENSRHPLRIGVRAGTGDMSARIARQLEAAGCVVERPFVAGDTRSLDAALREGSIDLYVESHAAALTQVLGKAAQPGPAAEALVREAYLRSDLLWAPNSGQGDQAIVFRKGIDQRCRSAARVLMTAIAPNGAAPGRS